MSQVRHVKLETECCPPGKGRHHHHEGERNWEMHPSWIAGIEALHAYGEWVSSVILPIAFQWVDEHKPEVYATVPEELKDDVGVVMAAAFRLVKDLPAYKKGLEKAAKYDAGLADGTLDTATINPVWTGITKKVQSATKEAFAEQSPLLGDIPE